MGKPVVTLYVALLAGTIAASGYAASYDSAAMIPPQPQREFRAAWIATVGNIDWPSRKTLSTAEQKAELVSILDRASKIGLNAVILQVRPACDALYASQLEPWSEYLTGAMGKAPEPYYDPLSFAIEEAHKRGLELHAWFNPYRARHPNARSPIAASHISKTKPHLVRQYGSYLWLDPGEREVQDHSLSVVLDVVRRYDVDGVHFDDYFYPYKESVNGRELDFPDEASWKRNGGATKLARNDWRRENVNTFIERVNQSVHAIKPWVKFGVSPFGIWRPGHPPQIKGFDAYDQLYADARHWLVNGWVDYFVPQLYWAIEPKEQSFPVLLDWWNSQNPKRRHIWPGLNTTKIGETAGTSSPTSTSRTRTNWPPNEIVSQVQLAAKQPISAGHVHWNAKSLLRSGELQAALARGPYAEPALVPTFSWLTGAPPVRPNLNAVAAASSVKLTWDHPDARKISVWVLQTKRGSNWTTRVLPAAHRSHILDGELPEALALSALDRTGRISSPASLSLRK